jgi:DNA-binding response OmpR family regulator
MPINPHRIVVVEDDPDVAAMLRYALERAGLSVRPASSVAEARRVLHDEPWDCVLLDRLLPDGDGMELCAELRMARPYGYILILTGENGHDDKVQGFALGADDYVTKPFNLDELLARIRAGLRIVERPRVGVRIGAPPRSGCKAWRRSSAARRA